MVANFLSKNNENKKGYLAFGFPLFGSGFGDPSYRRTKVSQKGNKGIDNTISPHYNEQNTWHTLHLRMQQFT